MAQSRPFALISERDARRLLDEREALRLVRCSFVDLGRKDRVRMPPKVYLALPGGDFRAMPVYLRRGGPFAGIKWISVFPKNPLRGLAAVSGTLLLNDGRTGRLLAVVEANAITALRTAAAAALASRMLCAKSETLALVGTGVQAAYQLRAHAAQFSLREVRVWSPDRREGEGFARRHGSGRLRIRYLPELRRCLSEADIICTCTPSRRVLVKADWVGPGTHINAIGADAPGKRELETRLLKKALIFVDDPVQAMHAGEINVPVSRGELTRRDITGTLTDVLLGRRRRKRCSDITVFDSTGLAVQDIALAAHLYRKITRRPGPF